MRCPRCNAKLAKKLPNDFFYLYQSGELYVCPVIVRDIAFNSSKETAQLVCPVCGYVLAEKVIK